MKRETIVAGEEQDEWMSTMFPEGHTPYGRIPLPVLGFCQRMKRDAFLNFLLVFSMMKIAKVIYREHSRFKLVHERDENGKLLEIIRTKRSPDDPPSFRLALPQRLPNGFDRQNPIHRAIGAAMAHTDTGGGSIDDFFEVWNHAGRFLRQNNLVKRQPNFDVALELLSAEKNRDLRLQDFKVMLAVNSCLGDKAYTIVTRKTIALRSAGAKDEETLRRLDGEPLTERQVEYALGKLQRKGFFHRVLVANRITFIAKAKALSETDLVAIAKRWKQNLKPGKAIRV